MPDYPRERNRARLRFQSRPGAADAGSRPTGANATTAIDRSAPRSHAHPGGDGTVASPPYLTIVDNPPNWVGGVLQTLESTPPTRDIVNGQRATIERQLLLIDAELDDVLRRIGADTDR